MAYHRPFFLLLDMIVFFWFLQHIGCFSAYHFSAIRPNLTEFYLLYELGNQGRNGRLMLVEAVDWQGKDGSNTVIS